MLFVYLAASDLAVAAVLVRKDESTLKPVYYVSKALTDVETIYFNAEKLAYALIIAARKLRAYFSADSMTIYMDAPLRKVLHKPEYSGQLLNWSIELTKFDIDYQPRKTIQAQPLADFIVETTFTSEHCLPQPLRQDEIIPKGTHAETEIPEDRWIVDVDGSVSKGNSRAGVLLKSPYSGEEFSKALRFKFEASNNRAEYEALITGMDLALSMGIIKIAAHSDSQLVVRQVEGEYGTIDPTLAKYCNFVRTLAKKF